MCWVVAAWEVSPRLREPNPGERAAVEVIEEPVRLQGQDKVILLCEDTAVMRRIIVLEAGKIVELPTTDFLRLLEEETRIHSADAVFDRALAAGRTRSRVEKFADHGPDIRDVRRRTLMAARTRRPS